MKIIFFILINFNFSLFCDSSSDFTSLLQNLWNFEEHTIQTEDGYLVKLFRVYKEKGKPILLIHGLLDSADDFFLNRKGSIGSTLVEQGYDIWLLNVRGNKYSCYHRTLDNSSFEFWNFSFHEMGKFDFPAALNHINSIKKEKISVIAHSQGTSLTYAGLALDLSLQKKVDKFIALAPIVFFDGINETKSYFYFLASRRYIQILNFFKIYKLLEQKINRNFLENLAIKIFCSKYLNVCDFFLKHFTDLDPEMIDNDQLPFFFEHVPSRMSTKSVDHYIQFMLKINNDFQQYDYGEAENQRRYNQKTPPLYPIEKINIPMYLYHGDDDELSTMQDVEKLKKMFPGAEDRFFEKFGHLTYFWGKDLSQMFGKILQDLKKDEKEEFKIQIV